MGRFRVLYMGTPEFAVPPLEALLAGPDEVVGVVTNPDRPSGRGRHLQAPPVKEAALRAGVPVMQPTKVRTPEFAASLASLRPDLAVVVAYGRILPPGVLAVPRLGCLNVHASVLPKLRGAAPINWAIVEGFAETGVSIMQLDAGMDTGPVYATATTPILPGETAGELHDRLMHLGPPLLMEVLEGLAGGAAEAVAQDESQATHARMIQKSDGAIDWSAEAGVIVRRVLGFNPWPGAFTTRDGGEVVRVHRAAVAEGVEGAAPGTVVRASGGELIVAAGVGAVRLLELQAPGRRAFPVEVFLHGHPMEVGSVLGAAASGG